MKHPNQTGVVRRYPLSFDSADGHSRLQGFIWWCANPYKTGSPLRPRGIVQLVHGMAEHIQRYDEFAQFLVGHGYLVCGHNQLGHGPELAEEARGNIDPQQGTSILLRDIDSIRQLVWGICDTQIPYFLFGHSMGSFEVRTYIAEKGEGLAGAILCGTGSIALQQARTGAMMARLISKLRGQNYKSKFLHTLADGAYAKAIKEAKTPFDWLSYNEENVELYSKDPACGFVFGAGAYATLAKLTYQACHIQYAQKVPVDLPLFFISGSEDVVGNNGEGVMQAVSLMQDVGVKDVSCMLYEHMRHEILNEKNRDLVYVDVVRWLDDHAGVERGERL